MKLSFNNISLISLILLGNIYGTVQYAEVISGGEITAATKKEIDEIISKNDLDSSVICRKTAEKLLNIYPQFKYGGFQKRWNYLFINEEFYNSLTKEEKEYFICNSLVNEKYKLELEKKRSKKAKIISGLSLGAVVASFPIGRNLHIREIPYYTILAGLGLSIYSIYKALQDTVFIVDNIIFNNFNCAQGALDYLNRLYKLDSKFVRSYMPNLGERIKNIKKYIRENGGLRKEAVS